MVYNADKKMYYYILYFIFKILCWVVFPLAPLLSIYLFTILFNGYGYWIPFAAHSTFNPQTEIIYLLKDIIFHAFPVALCSGLVTGGLCTVFSVFCYARTRVILVSYALIISIIYVLVKTLFILYGMVIHAAQINTQINQINFMLLIIETSIFPLIYFIAVFYANSLTEKYMRKH